MTFFSTDDNREHLETKRQVEELRRKYGEDDWLQGEGGDKLNEVLGIKREDGDGRTVEEIIAKRLSEAQSKEDAIDR